jgi:spore photoproduct lyase
MDTKRFNDGLRCVYIDPAVENDPQALAIAAKIKAPTVKGFTAEQVFDAIKHATDPIAAGKQTLFLTRNKGRFLKGCPGTRHYACCRYMILNTGTYCPMDCAYCILQTFFHPPVLQFFLNQDDMFAELDQFLRNPTVRRIGTGEYTDSLIWTLWTPLVEKLVTWFGRQSKVALELKTKTDLVAGLEGLAHNGKTILAWSLNSDTMIHANEIGTASLRERLHAAARCQAWGYPLAFHFDPIVIQERAVADYGRVIRELFNLIDPQNIAWISLGTLRCMPALKKVIRRRFPTSDIMYGEFITGLDGKMRYFKPLRVRIYRELIRMIRQTAPNVTIYFCMESGDVWEHTLGFHPQSRGGLAHLLDAMAIKRCRLDLA